jgi:uncharacterized membrane protein YdjX (TVP38/TMEM64 family)
VTGGFLFGLWIGTAASVIGATIGPAIVFLAARSACANHPSRNRFRSPKRTLAVHKNNKMI